MNFSSIMEMEPNNKDYDVFKLHSAISQEEERLLNSAGKESNWIDDLDAEKNKYKIRLDGVVKMHNSPLQRMDAHMNAFSLQGDVNESKHFYIRQLNDQMKVVREKRKPLLDKYTSSSKRYTGKQVDEMIEGDLYDLLFMAKTLEDHIDYLDSISSMMVNITFSMKYFKEFDDFTRK